MNYNFHFLYTTVIRDLDEIPHPVKLLMGGVFIYMIGWGVIEPFLSIYINQLFDSYFIVGLLFAVFFFITAVFSAPIGDLSDKAATTKIIPWLMFLYPFIAILYFLGGSFIGFLSFFMVFTARVIHGFASTLWVAVEAFVRQNSQAKHTAGIFGLYFTLQNLAFIIGNTIAIAAIILFGISFSQISVLFFGLLITPVIAALFISKIPARAEPVKTAIKEVIEKDRVFQREIADFKRLGNIASIVILQGYFMTALMVLGLVFLPLVAVNAKLSLVEIAVLVLAIHVPLAFSFVFSEIADRLEKFSLVSAGFFSAALILLAIALFGENTTMLFGSALLLGIIFAILQPTVNALLTEITPFEESGEMTGIFHSVVGISNAINALLIGTLASLFGISFPFIAFAFLFLLMAIVSLRHRRSSAIS